MRFQRGVLQLSSGDIQLAYLSINRRSSLVTQLEVLPRISLFLSDIPIVSWNKGTTPTHNIRNGGIGMNRMVIDKEGGYHGFLFFFPGY